MTEVATAFANAVIDDGYLLRPEDLLQKLRNPPGRSPSREALAVAECAARVDDQDAIRLIRATLDAATFGFLNLLDSDFKNSGLHATVWTGDSRLDTSDANGSFHDAYRQRIDPAGIVATELRGA